MSVRSIITRGLGAWGQGTRYLPTAGWLPPLPAPPIPFAFPAGNLATLEVILTITTFDYFLRWTDALDVATLLADAEVGLFQNPDAITPETVLADLTVADYTGYAAQPLVVTTPTFYVTPAGDFACIFLHNVFQPTGPTITNTVYGYFVSGTALGTGVRLLWAERFAEPAPMLDISNALIVEPRWLTGQPVGD